MLWCKPFHTWLPETPKILSRKLTIKVQIVIHYRWYDIWTMQCWYSVVFWCVVTEFWLWCNAGEWERGFDCDYNKNDIHPWWNSVNNTSRRSINQCSRCIRERYLWSHVYWDRQPNQRCNLSTKQQRSTTSHEHWCTWHFWFWRLRQKQASDMWIDIILNLLCLSHLVKACIHQSVCLSIPQSIYPSICLSVPSGTPTRSHSHKILLQPNYSNWLTIRQHRHGNHMLRTECMFISKLLLAVLV